MRTDKEILLQVGTTLRDCRKAKGRMQFDVCKAVGISQTYLSQIEHGHKNPSVSMLVKILRELGYTMMVIKDISPQRMQQLRDAINEFNKE